MLWVIKETEIAVIGAGPAGLGAAVTAASLGAEVTLIDRQDRLGGQLIKQTHMFFGSEKQHASVRGIDIPAIFADQMESNGGIELLLKTTALGCYEDGVITLERENGAGNENEFLKYKPESVIVATGASEKTLAFPNCDLPGIYGAGAVQTLMNVHGVIPGKRVVMIGAGNIGLIVSYQLMQAGVEVAAIVEALPQIGGYTVHASKIARLGTPILTCHTVTEAFGDDRLQGVKIVEIDENWQPVEGTEEELEADVLCVAVGLSPLAELLWQAGCEMVFVPKLGGYVAQRDENLETTRPGFFVAGDVGGIEEASSAMVEGQIAGYKAASNLGYEDREGLYSLADLKHQLQLLREGPVGSHIRAGLQQLKEESEVGTDA